MKRPLLVVGVIAAFVVAWSIPAVQAQEMEQLTFVPGAKANFNEVIPGVSKAVLWGNPGEGAYGAFTRMKPGMDAGLHTHTNDVWITVLKGAYVYKDDAGEKRVRAGDFIRIPGGMKHRSGSDKKEGALFYEEASGAFDLVPVK
jgi:quercetin dioxygenase-like cupin family protein